MENKIIFSSAVSSAEKKAVTDFVDEWKSEEATISIFTSGSTGPPKKVQIEKSAMVASAIATGTFFKFEKKQKILLCLSANYIAGMMQIVRAIVFEMSLYVVPVSSNPLREFNEEIDFAAFVPLQVKAILADVRTKERYENIKHVIIGGAPISTDLFADICHLKNMSFATFGMTETVSHIALKYISRENDFYQALPDISFGQSNNDTLIIYAKRITKDPIFTNDVVALKNSSSFQWLGRADFVINSGGVKLHPEVIESKLATAIKEPFYITKMQDATLGEKVILVIESEPYLPIKRQKIEDMMREILLNYEMPKSIVFQNEFQRSNSGKIIREWLIQ
jgi:O-succinylbenzoic acid--CoA ligase